MEQTAGTFQDRLITELRLAGATTVAQAKAVLQQFLPRFNRRFGVPAQCPEPAFRPMDPESRLGQILCFKHRRRVARDNTVKYYRHTLQLLPSQQRRSYAGASVVVLEGLDGRLSLQHEGRIIASQEAPPSPSSLRSRNGTSPSAAIPIPDPEPASKPSVADLNLTPCLSVFPACAGVVLDTKRRCVSRLEWPVAGEIGRCGTLRVPSGAGGNC